MAFWDYMEGDFEAKVREWMMAGCGVVHICFPVALFCERLGLFSTLFYNPIKESVRSL